MPWRAPGDQDPGETDTVPALGTLHSATLGKGLSSLGIYLLMEEKHWLLGQSSSRVERREVAL